MQPSRPLAPQFAAFPDLSPAAAVSCRASRRSFAVASRNYLR